MILRAKSMEWSFPRPGPRHGRGQRDPGLLLDGGRCATTGAAVTHALHLVDEGADLIDVGGESTRPDAVPVNAGEELRRVIPVLEQLASRTGIALSIDTMKPEVARAALAAGAVIVNDVAANRTEDAMLERGWRRRGPDTWPCTCGHAADDAEEPVL